MVWRPGVGAVKPHVVVHLSDLINAYPEATIAVDMPIGLSPNGKRTCDQDARRLLGAGRASSIFTPPIPEVLVAENYEEARQISIEHHPERKSLSIQAFGILPKIREVRATVTPELQERVFEVHPEVCFAALAGQPIREDKKGPIGYDVRRALLEPVFDMEIPAWDDMRKWVAANRLDNVSLRGPGPDDVLDAMVGAWYGATFR